MKQFFVRLRLAMLRRRHLESDFHFCKSEDSLAFDFFCFVFDSCIFNLLFFSFFWVFGSLEAIV